MQRSEQVAKAGDRRAGYTLPEVLTASAVAVLVSLGLMSSFVWCIRQSTRCAKVAWSEAVAMRSGAELTAYLRNASQIVRVDESRGRWVEVRFPDGGVGRIEYTNSNQQLRDGRLYLKRTNRTDMIIARGLTEIMDPPAHVFTRTGTNSCRVAYRVSEPASRLGHEADDADFAVSVRFAACLRNVARTTAQ